MSDTDAVIVSAARTPIGSFLGALATVPAHELGTVAIVEALKRAGVDAKDVDEVVLGQVLTAGQGQNPARQAAMAAGVPHEKTAYLVNQVCGSGLRTVALAFQAIKAGDATIMVAGGQESMSLSQHSTYMREGTKMGHTALRDTMVQDGLWDAFHDYHMGVTAENVAEEFKLSREDQDAFAASSQQKAEAAQKAGVFKDEIAPVTIKTRKGETVVEADEYPRHGTTPETLAGLRAAFSVDGTVTAGNASGINDGAAALVVMSAAEAERRGDRKSTRLNSSHRCISYAVFCLKKKKKINK